jgi:hypothetical protein
MKPRACDNGSSNKFVHLLYILASIFSLINWHECLHRCANDQFITKVQIIIEKENGQVMIEWQ